MLNLKVVKNIIPAFSIILVSTIIFWGNNFLTKNSYSIHGDTAFPLVMNYVNAYLFAWDQRGNFGLGQSSSFVPYLSTYYLVYLWSVLGLPLWIANRMWFIVPNIFLGFGAFYFYKSLFNNKYSWICGTLSSIFIMLLPEKFPLTVLELGFAGSLFSMGSIIHGLFTNEVNGHKNWRTVIIFCFGVMLASQGFRYFYIAIAIIVIITTVSIYCYRKEKQRLIQNFKFIIRCTALALLLNSFWIIPFYSLITGHKESVTTTAQVVESRLAFNKEHQKMTNPLYVLRASTGGKGLGRPPYYYHSHPLIVPFSFLVTLYCFFPLLLRRVNIKTKLLMYSSIPLTLFVVSFHFSPTINMFLRMHIPLFWPMGNPQYWVCYIAVVYGLIIGSTTEHVLFSIDHKENKLVCNTFNKNWLKVALVSCVGIVAIIFGGGVLLDKPIIAGFHSPYFLYGNKLPYIKIPSEYDRAEEYVSHKAKVGERAWYVDTGNYKKYTWSYKGHMPELLFWKLSIPTGGKPLSYATPMIDLVSQALDSKMYPPHEGLKQALSIWDVLNVKYLFLHKDYFYKADRDLTNYVRKMITKDGRLKIVMDNKCFTLYEIIHKN